MSTKQQLSGMLAIMALLFSSSTLFAQVKIGTNPTTINAANNLEVEASMAGRKISVDKTTGKVTIADGSEGIDKVLTSDAAGVATWLSAGTQNSAILFSVSNTANQIVNFGAVDKANFGVKNYDKNNNFDLTSDSFTVPATGTGVYQVSTIFASLNQAISQGVYVAIYVNNVLSRYIAIGNCAASAGIGGAGSILMPFTAGDVVDLRFLPSLSSPGQSITFFTFNLSVALISK
jgi:hypothetical protein